MVFSVLARRSAFASIALGFLAAFVVSCVAARPVSATPALTMDVATGDILYAQDATEPWYPASTTKLLTVYVALSAVRDHQIAMDTPLVVSARAHAMPPSKMGFPIGTQVTLDNALKMLMVRSANDIAITVAEGVAGSVEAFADDMNAAANQLGLHESHFVNPNGLPDPAHYSSARDLALVARALYLQFPEEAPLFNIGALALGPEIIANHNNLLGRYPGVDGMKTGFTCSAGFNIVASAVRDGRRLVVVVFGAPSVAARSEKVVALFDRGFAGIDHPIGSVATLPPSAIPSPPDMHDYVCRNRSHLVAEFAREVDELDQPLEPTAAAAPGGPAAHDAAHALLFNMQNVATAGPTATRINSMPAPVFDPIPVHIGAEVGYTGVVAEARAPHTPIGSEPQPVTASAYAATPPGPAQGLAGTPLAIDTNALPLRGRKLRLARTRHLRPTMRAAAEAPQTKILAEDSRKSSKAERKAAIGDSDGGGAKVRKSVKAAKAKPVAKAAKVAAKPPKTAKTPKTAKASKKVKAAGAQ